MPKTFKTLGIDSYDNVIRAALDGQGIALGFSGLVSKLIDQGRLIRPIEAKLSKGLAVYLVIPSTAELSPRVQEFIDWILAEAAGENA